nr:hypothetical protein [Tanacetum cinerariifolium]
MLRMLFPLQILLTIPRLHRTISSASPRNTASNTETESDPSEDPYEDHSAPLAISPFHDDPYMKAMQAYNATSIESPTPPPQAPIAQPIVLLPSPLFGP